MSLALGDITWVLGPSEQAPGLAGSMILSVARLGIERSPLVLGPEEEVEWESVDPPDSGTDGLYWGLDLTLRAAEPTTSTEGIICHDQNPQGSA